MKFTRAIVFILFLQLLSVFSFSQINQNKQFEKCKGKLPYPVCSVYKYIDVDCKKCDVSPSPYTIAFRTDSAAEVRAVHDGYVAKIFLVEDGYAIVTRFGDYYVTYYPIVVPTLKKGDSILCGQPMSKVSSPNHPAELNILMSKATIFIDPSKWFKW